MSKPLADFLPLVRSILVDSPDLNGNHAYSDDQITAALKTFVQTGQAPSCVHLDGENFILPTIPNPVNPNETIENNDTIGYIALNTALNLLIGSPAVSYRTRALSVTLTPKAISLAASRLEEQIHKLENKGNLCSENPTDLCETIYTIGDTTTQVCPTPIH